MDVVVVVVVIALLQYPGTVHPSCLPFDSLLPSVFFMFHVYTKYRVTTVFVYVTDHVIAEGGATHFGYLPRKTRPNGGDEKNEASQGLRVHPKAGSAAIWSNVDRAGLPDAAMVHEGESLNAGSLITIGEALQDERLPLKIGLNLWFTDRRDYPRPERAMVGEGAEGTLVYTAHDVH